MKLGFKDWQIIFPKPTPSKLLIGHTYLYNPGKLLKSMQYPWVNSLWVSSPKWLYYTIIGQIVPSNSSKLPYFLTLSLFCLSPSSLSHSLIQSLNEFLIDLYFVSTIILSNFIFIAFLLLYTFINTIHCRGPDPVDPGNSKRGRRWRRSGNNCLIKR